jgi:thioredoxin-related protein
MQFLCMTLLISMFTANPVWETDFQKAKVSAQTEHKFILLKFSGSDWCGPCIQMDKQIFNSETFSAYASEHLVLVNADFPRLKKNRLPAAQQKRNEQLAERYNQQGIFPLTLLLSPAGDILKKWEGYAPVTADAFTTQVKAVVDAKK